MEETLTARSHSKQAKFFSNKNNDFYWQSQIYNSNKAALLAAKFIHNYSGKRLKNLP